MCVSKIQTEKRGWVGDGNINSRERKVRLVIEEEWGRAKQVPSPYRPSVPLVLLLLGGRRGSRAANSRAVGLCM